MSDPVLQDAARDWVDLEDDELPDNGRITVSWSRWLSEQSVIRDWLRTNPGNSLGVRIGVDLAPPDVVPHLQIFELIVIEVEVFTDGRVFSLGRTIRERYGFAGELRASGDVLPDQITFLRRCGFNSIEPRNGMLVGQAEQFYTSYYQGSGALTNQSNDIRRARRNPVQIVRSD